MKQFGSEISFVFTNKGEPCKLQNDLRNMRHLQSHSFDFSRPGSFIWFSTENSSVQKTNENLIIIFPEVLKPKKFKLCNTVVYYYKTFFALAFEFWSDNLYILKSVFRSWKSVSCKTAVDPASRFCEFENFFQHRSRAKHWFKNLKILG